MIAIGCDHGGYELKQEIIAYLEEHKLEYKDYGCYDTNSVDYPEYAKKVAHAVADKKESLFAVQELEFPSLQIK